MSSVDTRSARTFVFSPHFSICDVKQPGDADYLRLSYCRIPPVCWEGRAALLLSWSPINDGEEEAELRLTGYQPAGQLSSPSCDRHQPTRSLQISGPGLLSLLDYVLPSGPTTPWRQPTTEARTGPETAAGWHR